jgi:hypothetical protein
MGRYAANDTPQCHLMCVHCHHHVRMAATAWAVERLQTMQGQATLVGAPFCICMQQQGCRDTHVGRRKSNRMTPIVVAASVFHRSRT